MKKTMITLAATCAAAVSMAAVTSQIVGYHTVSVPASQGHYYSPVFADITSGQVPVAALNGAFTDWTDTLQMMGADGYCYQVALWTDADGWLDANTFEPVGDLSLDYGECYMISCASPVEMTVGGQVETNAVEVVLPAGNFQTGNVTVSGRWLSEMTFAGFTDWTDTMQLMGEDGYCYQVALWTDADGWLDATTFEPADFFIPAGQGYLFNTAAGGTITIPSALVPAI